MAEATKELASFVDRYSEICISDSSAGFNTEVLEALELKNLLDLSLVTAECALNRTESRGGHAREDYPERNDDQFLKHTLAWFDESKVTIGYKDVDISRFAPKARTY